MENIQETKEIEFEQYDCLRINHEDFSCLYYPTLEILNVLYFDTEEDDEVEETIWTNEDGFIDCQFDRNVLEQDLLILRRVI